jgi:hypothetical protein
MRRALVLLLVPLACAEAPAPAGDPSDDPSDWPVDDAVAWRVQLGEPRWVVPGPAVVPPMAVGASNNNVEIELFGGRLYMAWRTSRDHWASAVSLMHVVSSGDGGATWSRETEVELGSDVREPRFFKANGALTLVFFQGGTEPTRFEPKAMWRTTRGPDGAWSPLEKWGSGETVPWDVKVRAGRVLMTSYRGEHYTGKLGGVSLFLEASTDGRAWVPAGPGPDATVYTGGVSEAAFELDEAGALWAVGRNEDGDDTGFGSLLCTAPASDLTAWSCPARSDPERYDSPEMFRHGRALYMVARRDVGGPYDLGRDDLGPTDKQNAYQLAYWSRPKRTALYRIDREARKVVHMQDLPGAGDTAFPSIRRTGAHTFLMANYTSPLDRPDIPWVDGQRGETRLYLQEIRFVAP